MDIMDLLLSAKLRTDLLMDFAADKLFIDAALLAPPRALKMELEGLPPPPRCGRSDEVMPDAPPVVVASDATLLEMPRPLVDAGPEVEAGLPLRPTPPRVAVERARLSANMDLALAALDCEGAR